LSNDYLSNIIKETLRLYSPANSLFPRVALNDHFIEDLKIYKGDLVNVSLYGMSINPNVFVNSLEFNPDRWIDQKSDDPY
jgi:cytochrome P450